MNFTALAAILDEAALRAKPVAQLSINHHFSLDEAYEIQRIAIEKRLGRGEKIVGLKMGFTSEAKMKQMGVNDLIWGILTDAMQIEDGGTLSLSKFIHPRAEPEVCFRIAKNIDRELDAEELMDHVDAIAPAIEIIDSRYENFKFSLEDVVADNCSSSGFVVGKWSSPKQSISKLGMRLNFGGKVVAEGSSEDIMGNPWKSLQAATRLAAQYQMPIKKGYVILAGAATAAEFISPQIEVQGEVENLGSARFSVL